MNTRSSINTRIRSVPIAEASAEHPVLIEAARIIQDGGLVAFPTETVYGLGADLYDAAAVERIFQAKGRPSDNPLIVHIAHRSQLDAFVEKVDPVAEKLMRLFWPGPLTLVLPARQGVLPKAVTAGLSTVAVRMPDHPVALALIEAADRPLPAPSANRSGRPSPTRAEHVLDDLEGQVELIIDGGETGIGLESTVVEVGQDAVVVLRPGGIPAHALQEALKEDGIRIEYTEHSEKHSEALSAAIKDIEAPRSPGMKYKHYAPKGEMHVVTGTDPALISDRIRALIAEARQRGLKTGVLTYEEQASNYEAEADIVIANGSWYDPRQFARQLYASLRYFDEQNVSYIVAEAYLKPPVTGYSVTETAEQTATDWLRTIFNRLQKAAEHRVIVV